MRKDPNILLEVYPAEAGPQSAVADWHSFRNLVRRTLGSTLAELAEAVPGKTVNPVLAAIIEETSRSVGTPQTQFRLAAEEIERLSLLVGKAQTPTERQIIFNLIKYVFREVQSEDSFGASKEIERAFDRLALQEDSWIRLYVGIERLRFKFSEHRLNAGNYLDAIRDLDFVQWQLSILVSSSPSLSSDNEEALTEMVKRYQTFQSRLSAFVADLPPDVRRTGEIELLEGIVLTQENVLQRLFQQGIVTGSNAVELLKDYTKARGPNSNKNFAGLLDPVLSRYNDSVQKAVVELKGRWGEVPSGHDYQIAIDLVQSIQRKVTQVLDIVTGFPSGNTLSPENIKRLREMVLAHQEAQSQVVHLVQSNPAIELSSDDQELLAEIVSDYQFVLPNIVKAKLVTGDEFRSMLDVYLGTLKKVKPEEEVGEVRKRILEKVAKELAALEANGEANFSGEAVPTEPKGESSIGVSLYAYLQTAHLLADSPVAVDRKAQMVAVSGMLKEAVEMILPTLQHQTAVNGLDPRDAYAILAVAGGSLDLRMKRTLLDVIIKGLSEPTDNAEHSSPLPKIQTLLLDTGTPLFESFIQYVAEAKKLEALVGVLPSEFNVRDEFRFKMKSVLDRPKDSGVKKMLRGLGESVKPNSAIYLQTRNWKLGLLGVFLLEMPLLMFWGPGAPFVALSIFSLIHVLILAHQNPERPLWQLALSFFIHFSVASPYAFIGVPGDVMSVLAATLHVSYDGILMALDQRRIRRDMAAFGVQSRRNFLLDLLVPAPRNLNVDTVDGRLAMMAQITDQLKAGDPTVTWAAKEVDTVAMFHQISKENIGDLGAYLEKHPARPGERMIEHLIVPATNDSELEVQLQEFAGRAGRNVTVLDHSFDPSSGALVIDSRHFLSWSMNKGSIAWLTTKSPDAVPITADLTIPSLATLLRLLNSALPITRANLDAMDDFARAIFSAA